MAVDASLSPRDRVLGAAMGIIVEKGLDKLRLSEIGERCGMSTGHVLYYFGTKDRILIETLLWSEREVTDERRRSIAGADPGWPQLDTFVETYVPMESADPRWSLWAEVWARRLHTDYSEELTRVDSEAMDDLRGILSRGRRVGAFRTPPKDFARRFVPLLDGLSIHVLERTLTRSQALSLAHAHCRSEL
jgi:AcrR family transcriptional regulator